MKLADVQLTSLEEELRVLRVRLRPGRRSTHPPTFTSLRGLWKGRANLSWEAIRHSEVRLPSAP